MCVQVWTCNWVWAWVCMSLDRLLLINPTNAHINTSGHLEEMQ